MGQYQAGTAFVNVLPSFAEWAKSLVAGTKNFTVVLPVTGDFSTWRAEAAKAAAALPPTQVAIAPSTRQFLAELDAMAAKIPPEDVQLRADTAKLRAEIEAAGSKVGGIDVPLTADEAKFRAELKQLGAHVEPVKVPVEPDSKGFSDKLSKAGPAAGAALAAGFAVGFASGTSAEDLAATFTAKLGTTQAQSAELGKLAGQIYAENYGESASEVAGALQTTLQSNFGKTLSTADLKTYTENALTVAGSFDQDINGITNAVNQMLTTGLVKNSGEALDVLTKGFQNGADKSGDLLDTFNEYGTQFRKLGLSGKDALGLIQQGLQGGARDGDLAADAFKEFGIRAIDGSKTTIDAYQQLGLNAGQMTKDIAAGGPTARAGLDKVLTGLKAIKDPAKQAAIASELFGTQSEDLGKALYSFDVSTAASSMGDFTDAAQNANNALGTTASARIETFKRSLQSAFTTTLGGLVIPAVTSFLNLIAPVTSLVGGAGNAITLLIVPLAALAGLWISVTAAQKIYQGAMTVWSAATKIWTGVQAAFNFVMALNPFTLIIIAIIAFIAIIVIAYTKSDTFRAIVQAAWQGIKTAVGAVWTFLRDSVFAPLVSFFTVAGPAAVNGLKAVISVAWNAIKTVISVAWTAISVVFGLIKTGLSAVGTAATFLWNNVITPAFNGIKAIITAQINLVTGVFTTFKSGLSGIGTAATALWNGPITTAWNGIKNAITTAINLIQKPIDALLALFDKVIAGAQRAKDAAAAVTGGATSVGKKALSILPGFATGGIYPGYTPGRDVGVIGVSGGEAIMRPEWTRAVGSDYVHSANAAAARGGRRGLTRFMGGYAMGGIVGPSVGAGASGGSGRDVNFNGPVNVFDPRELAGMVSAEQRRADALLPKVAY